MPNLVEPAKVRTELKFSLRASFTWYVVAGGDYCLGGRKRSVDFGKELETADFIVELFRPLPVKSFA